MQHDIVLYGFDGSTYARTVRTLLAAKGAPYENVEVNVLRSEPTRPEHLARHPFGKIPVVDIDGFRIRETDAICRYLDETLPGRSFTPEDAKARARMNEAINLINSYGYTPLIGVAAYHLFPTVIGGKDDGRLAADLENGGKLLTLLMENRSEDPWLAGPSPSLADLLLGPLVYYVSLTPSADRLLTLEGVHDWWQRMQTMEGFAQTAPKLG